MINGQIKQSNITSGNVKIELFHGEQLYNSIITHNSGTVDLCKYISDALSGKYIVAQMPGYIVPCIVNSQGELEDMFSYGIPYTGVSQSSDDRSASTVLKFLIPSTLLSTTKEIKGFRLYSFGVERKLYATVDIRNTPVIVEGQDTNISVSWTLKVSPEL